MKLTDVIQTEYLEVTQKDISQLKEIHSSAVDGLCLAFDKWMENSAIDFREDFWSGRTAENLIENISYTQEDMSIFSLQLSSSKKYLATTIIRIETFGIFFSALINTHYKKTKEQKTYTLFFSDICSDLGYLGLLNDGANILIHGNAGFNLGERMRSGKITVTNYSNISAGIHMTGGELHLNEALSPGQHMSGGKIYVQNARGMIGAKMKGGEIHISESYEDIDRECFGNIYFKNELIFSKGKSILRGKK